MNRLRNKVSALVIYVLFSMNRKEIEKYQKLKCEYAKINIITVCLFVVIFNSISRKKKWKNDRKTQMLSRAILTSSHFVFLFVSTVRQIRIFSTALNGRG